MMNIRFSKASGREGQPLTDSRSSLVGGFSKSINNRRQRGVTPSDHICFDESISRWYDLGGEWITMGRPYYVAYGWKLKNGGELRAAVCGKSEIILEMRLVVRKTGDM